MSEKDSGLPKDSAGWLEYLKNIDPRDHRKTMVALGAAAALGIGVGVYAISKKRGGGHFFIRFGDRRMQEHGIISAGEIRDHGPAVSFPTGEASRDSVAGKEIFAMDDDGTVYPNVDEEDLSRYKRALNTARGWFIDHLTSQTEPPGGQTGTE